VTRPEAVFITGVGAALPNAPVDNDSVEKVLGLINGRKSLSKRRILKVNGIEHRYYAIDPSTGRQTHTNAQLTAEAARAALEDAGMARERLDCLACGTSSPDQWIPGHGLMVHGELGNPPCEVVSTAGVCVSGVTALKYAYASLLSGLASTAVATGSELSSSVMRAARFEGQEAKADETERRRRPAPFQREFLRWMLSDGAGAVALSTEPRPDRLSLRIEWIECVSYAGELETCMYWGAEKQPGGSLRGWREFPDWQEALHAGCFNLSQDVQLLGDEVGTRSIRHGFRHVLRRHDLKPDQVSWLLPHYSSEYFRQEVHDQFAAIDFPLPFERWFTNLSTKGNTGAASIYIMLEELLHSGRVREGDALLCLVPESARFSVAYMLLRAVRKG
jgi:3-oxoacyl-[acyl-carrier-protein] synthase-3